MIYYTKYRSIHLHAMYTHAITASYKAHWFAPRKREVNLPSEVAQHVRSLRVFPRDYSKVRFTSPEEKLSEHQSGRSVCTVRVSLCECVSVRVCVHLRAFSHSALSSLNVSFTPSCNLTPVWPLPQHQLLASHRPSLQNPFATISSNSDSLSK